MYAGTSSLSLIPITRVCRCVCVCVCLYMRVSWSFSFASYARVLPIYTSSPHSKWHERGKEIAHQDKKKKREAVENRRSEMELKEKGGIVRE